MPADALATSGSRTAGLGTLVSAPHRVFFLAGTVQLFAVMLPWGVELAGRYTQAWTPIRSVVPMTWAHGFLMAYGTFSFFILGFLMTTFPRWTDTTPLSGNRYLPPAMLMVAGLLLFYPGLLLSRTHLAVALLLYLCGWGLALRVLWSAMGRTSKTGMAHEYVLLGSLLAGVAGVLAGVAWLALPDSVLAYRWSTVGGVWLFLLPVLFTVSHRMIPFFASCVIPEYQVYRPTGLLLAGAACLLLHGIMELWALRSWLLAADLPLFFIVSWLWWRWRPFRGMHVPLLGMLHVAFSWLVAGMLLRVMEDALLISGSGLSTGRASLHALGIGYAASMLLAMVSRVSMGHSGRPLAAGRLTLACFVILQGAVLARIAAELPPLLSTSGGGYANLLAAGTWLLLVPAWMYVYVPIYLRPRIDGKPG